MTLEAFYEALTQAIRAKRDTRLVVTTMGSLRLVRDNDVLDCPITFVAHHLGKGDYVCADVENAAHALGMTHGVMCRVLSGSDGVGSPQTRQRLGAIVALCKERE